MTQVTDMLGRLGLLGLALFVCVMKLLYTFGLELNTTGGEAAYILVVHDVYVAMTLWTTLLVVLVLTTGAAAVGDLGRLKFLHTTYFLAMAAVAAFGVVNDAGAMTKAIDARQWVLLAQFTGEVLIVFAMGQQLWAVLMSLGQRAVQAASDATRNF